MPIDYSKFDAIEDSDEDDVPDQSRAVASAIKAAQTSAASGRAAFSPHPRSGRETLEARGIDNRLQIVQPQGSAEMERLASQLESLAGPRGSEASASGVPGSEPADPSEPKRLCMRSEGRKKIHTTFADSEMVEEFDERTDVLLLRKVRKTSVLGKESEWVFEVGQAPEPTFDPHSDLLRASSSNPIFLRKDTPEHFQWRIRNLPYPANVYSVAVDHEKQDIVVRTSNKKYYKRISVPDIGRVGLKLQDAALSWRHQHNTLIISYTRPQEVAEYEQKALQVAERQALTL